MPMINDLNPKLTEELREFFRNNPVSQSVENIRSDVLKEQLFDTMKEKNLNFDEDEKDLERQKQLFIDAVKADHPGFAFNDQREKVLETAARELVHTKELIKLDKWKNRK